MTIMVCLDAFERNYPAVRLEAPWNGWAVPVVTTETRDQLIAFFGSPEAREGDAGDLCELEEILGDCIRELMGIEPNPDGTFTLDLGWTFTPCEAL
jgi:hypothetical protein